MDSHINIKSFSLLVLFVFLTAFLYTVEPILSPFLIGGVLLFILFGYREAQLARQLSIGVVLLLFVWIFSKAQGVLFPLIVSFILAYLFDPVIDFLVHRKLHRAMAAGLVLLITFGLIITTGILIIPDLIGEVQDLIKGVPDLAKQLAGMIDDLLNDFQQYLNVGDLGAQESWVEKLPTHFEQVFLNIIKGLIGVGAFLSRILNIVLVPVLTFYMLKDFDQMTEWGLSLVPKKYRSVTYFYLWRFHRILGGYLRGQLIVCMIIGFLTGLGLAILRVPYAILLGIMTAVFGVIPFVGFYISLGICFLTAMMSPTPLVMAVKIVSVFLFVQGLESYVISPKIVGDRVGLHPVAVIFSILVFSKFFGFWGLLAGVPTAALIKFLLDEWKRRLKRREILAERSST